MQLATCNHIKKYRPLIGQNGKRTVNACRMSSTLFISTCLVCMPLRQIKSTPGCHIQNSDEPEFPRPFKVTIAISICWCTVVEMGQHIPHSNLCGDNRTAVPVVEPVEYATANQSEVFYSMTTF